MLDCKLSLQQSSTKRVWLLKFCTWTAAPARRSRRIGCLCSTSTVMSRRVYPPSDFYIDRASLRGRGLTRSGALICSRGHYDLLYKTEDVEEMSRHALSNPEIRHVSTPSIALSNHHTRYSQIDNLELLSDIPGFSSSMIHTPFPPTSTEPYQSKVETFSSPPCTMTPATPIYPQYHSKVESFPSTSGATSPATPIYPSVDPAVKEEFSPKAVTNSPVSPTPKELPIQADFRPRTKQQRRYDNRRFKGQGEPLQSDYLNE